MFSLFLLFNDMSCVLFGVEDKDNLIDSDQAARITTSCYAVLWCGVV